MQTEATLAQSDVSELDLVKRCQAGDTEAFDGLVTRYRTRVFGMIYNMVHSEQDAWDLAQDSFLKAWKSIGRFRGQSSFYTWIYRIVTNLCLDHLRKKRSRGRDMTSTASPEGEPEDVLDRMPDRRPGASPERSFAGRELRQCIVSALSRLSPRERMVFELKHYHGMRLRTVAGMLNTTEGTIKNTLFRATHKLRTQLAEVR